MRGASILDFYSDLYSDPERGLADLEKECKFCGAFPLFWKKGAGGKWKLYELSGKIHKCKRHANNFDPITE
jgi:hypothetical protein